MGSGVNLSEPLDTHMGVDLSRAEIFMPQQLLNAPQIGTGIQQVCCKGVAQFVRCEIRGQSCKKQVFLKIAVLSAIL